jgi:hypothetical protein
VKKRKRAPGAGRKPKGEFSRLGTAISWRMPPLIRDRLEESRKVRGEKLGREISLSQELMYRVNDSLNRERNAKEDRLTRSINHALRAILEEWEKQL